MDLSAVVVTPSGLEPLRETVDALRDQAGRDRIELVVVAPGERAGLREAVEGLDGLGRTAFVAAGAFSSTGRAVAAGVAAATAPVVVYVEEHAFPEPGWAEALVAAHEGPWAAVGAVLHNANPGSAVSWASLTTDFGMWLGHDGPVELDRLPPHQTSYKRELLVAYGDGLGDLLEVESMLHADLVAHGHRLLLEPAAAVRHLNPSLLGSYMRAELHGGRLFAATRAQTQGWSRRRRAGYVAAAPLIPFVRLGRIVGDLRRMRTGGLQAVRILGPIAAGVVAHTAGECAGYAAGRGDSPRLRIDSELHRRRHLRDDERAGS